MKKTNIRALAEGAVMVALAWALSYVKLDFWADGGSISLVMVPLIVYAVRWGISWGVGAGFVFGVVKFLLGGGFAIAWQSILLDYTLAYAAAGLAGLAKGRKNAIVWGALIGCGARFVFHFISGFTIWAQYMPDEFLGITMASPVIYSAIYNGGYMGANAIITAAAGFFLQKPLERLPAGDNKQA